MKRVGALLGAVAMVVGALVVRGVVGGDDSSDRDGPATRDVVVCPEEFAEVCAGLDEVQTRPMSEIADDLLAVEDADDLDAATWVLPAAWAELVVAERERGNREAVFEIEPGVLASSAVVATVWRDRADQLDGACGGEVGWRCLAEQTGQPLEDGDRVSVGVPEVDSTSGLLVAAEQVGALLGRSDYATNDFDAAFETLASRLAGGQVPDPLGDMRSRGPGEFTASGVLEADASNVSSNFGEVIVLDGGDPAVRVDVVVLSAGGGDLGGEDREQLAQAFLDAGWDPAADGPDGLPAGGVLAAVRTLWSESR